MIRYGESAAAVSGQPAGSVMEVIFRLAGQRFTALNGGPLFQFTPALPFAVEGNGDETLWRGQTKLRDSLQNRSVSSFVSPRLPSCISAAPPATGRSTSR